MVRFRPRRLPPSNQASTKNTNTPAVRLYVLSQTGEPRHLSFRLLRETRHGGSGAPKAPDQRPRARDTRTAQASSPPAHGMGTRDTTGTRIITRGTLPRSPSLPLPCMPMRQHPLSGSLAQPFSRLPAGCRGGAAREVERVARAIDRGPAGAPPHPCPAFRRKRAERGRRPPCSPRGESSQEKVAPRARALPARHGRDGKGGDWRRRGARWVAGILMAHGAFFSAPLRCPAFAPRPHAGIIHSVPSASINQQWRTLSVKQRSFSFSFSKKKKIMCTKPV
jgi:hypothetical protein